MAKPQARPAQRVRRVPLFLRRKELLVRGDAVLFQPRRNARRSRYITYRFSRKVFQRKMGPIDRVKRVLVYCRVLGQSTSQVKAVAGTIRITTIRCGLDTFQDILADRRKAKRKRLVPLERVKPMLRLPRDKHQLTSQKAVGRQAWFSVKQGQGSLFTWKNKTYQRFELIPTNRKSATYIALLVPNDQWSDAVGRASFQKAQLHLRIQKVARKVVKPSDPRVSAPLGGFSFYKVVVTVVKAQVTR